MKKTISLLALLSLLSGQLSTAQTNEPVVEDFKPSSLNQSGKQYPQVNSERRVRARVVAPLAQSVMLDFLGSTKYPLTKGDDGAWVGVTRSQDEGFHYYLLVIDGAPVPDPGSLPTSGRPGGAACMNSHRCCLRIKTRAIIAASKPSPTTHLR